MKLPPSFRISRLVASLFPVCIQLGFIALANNLRAADPAAVSVTPIVQALTPFLNDNQISGVVTLVANKEKVLDLEAAGFSDLKTRTPMKTNDEFWIASMSKAITAAGLMILVDEGKVNLDDPVAKYLPEFNKISYTPPSVAGAPSSPVNESANVTVRRILSHTAGMKFLSSIEKPTLDGQPLSVRASSYATTPLDSAPGTEWKYSNMGVNTAGRIIEAVSGMPYEEFLQKRLFDPLGMTDTTFWPDSEHLSRLAKSYKPGAPGVAMTEIPITPLTYPLDSHTNRYPMPAGGLFSTAVNLSSFCQMLLNKGVNHDGTRILSQQAVTTMTTPQNGNIKVDAGGSGYGFGLFIRTKAGVLSAGSFGHGGAYQTVMWVDPAKNLIFVILVQIAGPGNGMVAAKIQSAFFKAAMQEFRQAP